MRFGYNACKYKKRKGKGERWNFYRSYSGYNLGVLGKDAFMIFDNMEEK